METLREKPNKKGKNKGRKNSLQPGEELSLYCASWDRRLSTIRRKNQAHWSWGDPPVTWRSRKSVNKQSEPVPKYHICKRPPADVQQKDVMGSGDPEQLGDTPVCGPQADLCSGLTQRALRGFPVRHRKYFKAPYRHSCLRAPAKRKHDGNFKVNREVETSFKQARTPVLELQLQENETADVENVNMALATMLEQFQKTQREAGDGMEATPRQAMVYISEVDLHQLNNREMMLKSQNEGLTAEIQQLTEAITRGQALHDEAVQKRVDTIHLLELQLVEKKASEAKDLCKLQQIEEELQRQREIQRDLEASLALHDKAVQKSVDTIRHLELQLSEKAASEEEALCKLQQVEEELQRQRESQKELSTSLAQEIEKNNTLMATLIQTQGELRWLDEKSCVLQAITDLQLIMKEETVWKELMDRIMDVENVMDKLNQKPRKRSLWRNILGLFK